MSEEETRINYVGYRGPGEGTTEVLVEYIDPRWEQPCYAPLPFMDDDGYDPEPWREAHFEWGYGGAGPHDLAFSILAHALGERPTEEERRHGRSVAWRLHQEFCRHFTSQFQRMPMGYLVARVEAWRVTQREVLDFLHRNGVRWAGVLEWTGKAERLEPTFDVTHVLNARRRDGSPADPRQYWIEIAERYGPPEGVYYTAVITNGEERLTPRSRWESDMEALIDVGNLIVAGAVEAVAAEEEAPA